MKQYKKYKNRKLYDVAAHDYVTLEEVVIAAHLVNKSEWTNDQLSLLSSKKSMANALVNFYDIIRTRKTKA